MYQLDKNQEWIKIAKNSANFLINTRDKGKKIKELYHDHWLLYALNELYRISPEEYYLTHARNISKAILRAQKLSAKKPDEVGSFYKNARSTPAATRAEGLMAAYHLFNDNKDTKFAKKILASVRKSVLFQLGTQIRFENSIYFPRPQKALGGFRKGIYSDEIRIDYVNHNISSIIALLDVMFPRPS